MRVSSQCMPPPPQELGTAALHLHVPLHDSVSSLRLRSRPVRFCRFLSGRQSDGIVSDLVRFIIVGFHPNNKLLQSQVVPRWALLGWILTCWYAVVFAIFVSLYVGPIP